MENKYNANKNSKNILELIEEFLRMLYVCAVLLKRDRAPTRSEKGPKNIYFSSEKYKAFRGLKFFQGPPLFSRKPRVYVCSAYLQYIQDPLPLQLGALFNSTC